MTEVQADMNRHTVTVKMNEPAVKEAVVKALNAAGYTTGEPAPAPEGKSP